MLAVMQTYPQTLTRSPFTGSATCNCGPEDETVLEVPFPLGPEKTCTRVSGEHIVIKSSQHDSCSCAFNR